MNEIELIADDPWIKEALYKLIKSKIQVLNAERDGGNPFYSDIDKAAFELKDAITVRLLKKTPLNNS